MNSCFAAGLDISNNAHHPEGLMRNILPKPLSIVAAVISGIMKTLFFPLTTLFFTLAFTGKAIYEFAKGKESGKYVVAALLNFAGLAAFVLFLGVSAFYLPFSVANAFMLTAISVSIVYHVIKAVKA